MRWFCRKTEYRSTIYTAQSMLRLSRAATANAGVAFDGSALKEATCSRIGVDQLLMRGAVERQHIDEGPDLG